MTIAGGPPVDVRRCPGRSSSTPARRSEAAAGGTAPRAIDAQLPEQPQPAPSPTPGQIEEIVAAAVAADLWIISDEIYASITYDGAEFLSPAKLAPERTLVVNGGSKSHSLTGWRIGFLAGPATIIAAAAKMQSQAIGNPCSISQAAAVDAATGDHRGEIARRVAEFDARRRYLVPALDGLDGVHATLPKGAFYVMADVRELCARLGVDDVELAGRLLDQVQLAVVPGTPFAAPGFIRLSYAASVKDLEEGVARLQRFIGSGG